ncbi:MAG: site-specific DNA-methyltransferase, partial [Bacillota bacterium]|nr:site-specific DNA-methyltransferase [Bacillota bacterium]
MDKLKMESVNITNKNIERIGALFPNVLTEVKDEKGILKKAINFQLLKQELSDDLVEGEECFDFNWVGKKAAILEGNAPIRKTLRPCIEESINWEKTGNLYIEGDNLEVLKLLQESYLNSVKMIYIDPPYNTGKDFIYKDSFKMNKEEYEEQLGLYDEEKNRLFLNTDTNGRFHSDWCSMLYPRIRLAHNLLREDGVMFISISDIEVDNLKKICNEVFGEDNFVADIIWNSTKSVTNTALISVSHTHNLVYFKSMAYFVKNREKFRLTEDGEGFANPDNDPRGLWKADPFQVGGWRPNQQYEIVNPNTGVAYKPNPNCSWKNDYPKFQELLKDNRIVFGKTGEG